MNPRVFLRGAGWGVRQCVGTVWGSMGAVGTLGAPDHGVHWSSMGPGGPLDGGQWGEVWGIHACLAWVLRGGQGEWCGALWRPLDPPGLGCSGALWAL